MEALKIIAILSKWTNLETNTDEMYKCFQYLLYQLSSKLISNHDTLLLLISAVDLRSINPSASTLLREWFRARHSWPVDPDVSRGAIASLRWRRACGLQCQLYRTPHIVVKSAAFYTLLLWAKHPVAASLRLASQPQLRAELCDLTVNSQWYFITKHSSLKETNKRKHEAQKIDK